jgi:PAS domain S-box-containing protein
MSDLTVRPQDLGFGDLFDEIRDAVVVADATTGRIVNWNRAAAQIFGYSSSEAVGLPVEVLVPERLRERYRAALSRYRELGRGAYIDPDGLLEVPAMRKEGEEINIEMSLSPIALARETGEADGRFVLAIVREVTERNLVYDRFAESESRFARVLSNAHAYIYRCRNHPSYPNEFASDYALTLTGYAPQELMVDGDVRFGDLIVEEDKQRVWDEVQRALSSRESFEVRYAIRRRDGEIRHVQEYGQGVYGEGGEVVALEGLVYDVTEGEGTVQRLREAEQRYRTLIERISAVTYIQEATGSHALTYVSPQMESMLGVQARGMHLRPRALDKDPPPRRSQASAGGGQAHQRNRRALQDRVSPVRQGRSGGVDSRRGCTSARRGRKAPLLARRPDGHNRAQAGGGGDKGGEPAP